MDLTDTQLLLHANIKYWTHTLILRSLYCGRLYTFSLRFCSFVLNNIFLVFLLCFGRYFFVKSSSTTCTVCVLNSVNAPGPRGGSPRYSPFDSSANLFKISCIRSGGGWGWTLCCVQCCINTKNVICGSPVDFFGMDSDRFTIMFVFGGATGSILLLVVSSSSEFSSLWAKGMDEFS